MTHHIGRLRSFSLALLVFALVCGFAAPALGVSRVDVIARATVWTDSKVPYSQTRYATVAGSLLPVSTSSRTMGYRTDCSGFVSMALDFRGSSGLPYSADTAGLGRLLTKITKEELKPGDVILRPKDLKIGGILVPYGHAVIFGGWIDSAQTKYWCLHESSSSRGTVIAAMSYGVSGFGASAGYAPYRYAGVRDRVRAPRTFGR